jgi:RNA polymerase sigma factor (sigma-70 family)
MATLTRHARPDRAAMRRPPYRRPASKPLAPTAPPRPLDADRQALAEANLPLAYGVSWDYRRRAPWVPADELIAEAFYSLTYAAGRFDPATGVPFPAYARLAIRHRLGQLAKCWYRRRRNMPLAEEDADGFPAAGVAEAGPDPAELAAQRDECDRVRRVMPGKWYTILWDRFAVGLIQIETAARLDVSRQAVDQLEGRALRRARTVLRGGLQVGP